MRKNISEQPLTVDYADYQEPDGCYCCWLAGRGGMPPCGWCTNPLNFDFADEDDSVVDPQPETDNDRFDRVMKELGF